MLPRWPFGGSGIGATPRSFAGRPDSFSNGLRNGPFSIAIARVPLLNAACGSAHVHELLPGGGYFDMSRLIRYVAPFRGVFNFTLTAGLKRYLPLLVIMNV